MDRRKNDTDGSLLKVLRAHFDSLVYAGCQESVLKEYADLLSALKSGSLSSRDKSLQNKRPDSHPPLRAHIVEDDIRNASLDGIEKLVANEKTTRKDLELIATLRFSVPHGSMRSYSGKQLLVDKLRTLIRNERAHETISTVARAEVKKVSDS